jgi:hypothetical protein
MRLMDEHHIEQAVNLSGGEPGRGLEAQLEAASAFPGRVIVFTTLAYRMAAFPDYGTRMADALRRAHTLGARGLKIAKLLGLGLLGPDHRRLAVDDPGLDIVFETAAELGMPIAIHTGDPEAFFRPVDADNERRAELLAHPGPSFSELHQELLRRIERHPRARFISVHFGNWAENPQAVASELRKYPNLYIDTAARIPEIGRKPPALLSSFFEEFQDRVLFGSDLGVGADPEPLFLGSSGDTPPTPREERLFFDSTFRYFESADERFDSPTPIQGDWQISGINLPPSILRKLYFDNARRLLGH